MKSLALALTLGLFAASSVFAQKVTYNFDDQADFSSYSTYDWVKIDDSEVLDELTDRQIREAIDRELLTKGLRRVENGETDLHLGYQVSITQEGRVQTYGTDWGYGPGWRRGMGMGATSTTSRISTIDVGTFALDIYDVEAHRLVWRGVATRTLSTTKNPAKREKRMNKGVVKLLKNYPPGSDK